jgi:hypothetical protein
MRPLASRQVNKVRGKKGQVERTPIPAISLGHDAGRMVEPRGFEPLTS